MTTLNRRDRKPIYWPLPGLPDGATVTVEMEQDGNWQPLVVGVESAAGLFAGPDHPAPAGAILVDVTSHCRLSIETADGLRWTEDGGFIQLVG